ncbi:MULTISPECIES: DNA replication/repair protein RecF [unclassified Methylophaga]|uniref:DNA replication/repair protein RecF n=2 Tax=Methylophaga TaxID=40222 RepID=UPI000C91EED6|nr:MULTISPECIES: DNA replication/repair protein RecF [unclassified Methylophaga]MAK68152.1 DNA replication/repair protein RecF [Methylophaga sp.]MAY17827.1 DNA replication/repair protein RecF [Methylophaga sp.]HAO26310.1 DNA replication/repair protein RecF [Methylophaga sp.]HCD03801.1 DNA replication/repair protein RecF [Methylophaga sp.]
MLTELTLTHFRNIQKAVVYPDPGINILSGENGSGKTSVLEAIYLLAMGRSFRTRNLKNVIQTDEVHFQVFARIKPGIPVGLQFSSATGIQIRLNNAPLKKLSELASHLPLQYIPANCHQFFELGPAFRRRVVDWGLFHVEQDFLFHWQAYKKILSQRNAALRNNKPVTEIRVWNVSLVEHGLHLSRYRNEYLMQLLISFEKWFNKLCKDFNNAKFELRYLSGWPKEHEFKNVIETTIDRDRALGYTRSGPHAADWSIRINGNDPAEVLSRGQQKLFFLAISLAQISLLQQFNEQKSILLVDDISSELDVQHQHLVLDCIKDLRVQTFITTTSSELNAAIENDENGSLFHVERGELRQI